MSCKNLLPLLLDACMDTGSRAPTVGALGDAGAIAERVGVRRLKSISYIPLGNRSCVTLEKELKA